jgi:Big-like domain-containing protein
MHPAQFIRLVPVALLVLGCSDPSGPTPIDDSPPDLVPIDFLTLSVAPASATIRTGESVRLAATISGSAALLASEPIIAWFSANDAVAAVSGTGLVQGLRAGTAVIWATYRGKRATAHVTVLGPGKKPDPPPHGCLPHLAAPPGDSESLISC